MTAIFVTAGIAALIWSAVLLRFGGLLSACLGVLVLGTVWGPPFFSYQVGSLPLTADRVLLASLLLLYLAGRWGGLVSTKPFGRADAWLGILLAVLTASLFTHDWRFEGAQPISNFVFYYLAPAALFWLARESKLNQRQLAVTCGLFGIFGIYLAVTAIAEANQIWWLVYPKFIASAEHEEFFGRGRGPILNPVGTGLYMIAGLASFSSFWPRRDTRLGITALQMRQLATILGSALIVVGLYFTLTRSVWVATVLVLALIVVPRIPRPLRPSLAIASLLLVSTLVVLKWDQLQAFKRDKHVSAHEMSQSAGLRPVLASVAWKMFVDRPVLGCGFGQYKKYDMNYLRDPNIDLPLERARPYNQHNIFLALLTETGLIGLGAFLAVGAYWIRDALTLWRAKEPLQRQMALVFVAVMVAYLFNGMLHDLTVIPMVHMLVFALAGICRGLVAKRQVLSPSTSLPRTTSLLQPVT